MWAIAKDDGEVTVWKDEKSNSRLMSFRARKIMGVPIETIVSILMDDNSARRMRWVDLLTEWREVDRSECKATIYAAFGMPFPVKARDFVFEVSRSLNAQDKTVTIKIRSVEHPAFPESKSIGVRGALDRMSFCAKMLGRRQTEVMLESHIDPRGSVPQAAANFVNRRWPENTLRALETEARRHGVKPDEETLAKIVKSTPKKRRNIE